jgi:hypothetical protein
MLLLFQQIYIWRILIHFWCMVTTTNTINLLVVVVVGAVNMLISVNL